MEQHAVCIVREDGLKIMTIGTDGKLWVNPDVNPEGVADALYAAFERKFEENLGIRTAAVRAQAAAADALLSSIVQAFNDFKGNMEGLVTALVPPPPKEHKRRYRRKAGKAS